LTKPIYIFAGGGTGGHLYPGLAVAEQLHKSQPEAKIVFACSDRSIDRKILDSLGRGFAAVPQPIKPLPRSFCGWGRFCRSYIASCAQARDMLGDLKPAAVLGLGGFAAANLVSKAAKVGIPTAMLNPDAVPGIANRHLSKHARVIFTQFESTQSCFAGRLQERVRCVGCPVRSDITNANRAQALEHFGLDSDRKTLLVLGGSFGAASINKAVYALADKLDDFAQGWQIIHITGEANESAQTPFGKIRVVSRKYCDHMDLAYAASDLALCRGGASTIAELTATATPAVIMPYPHHRDQQQKLNAAELVSSGTAVICEDEIDTDSNKANLGASLIPILQDEEQLLKMHHGISGSDKSISSKIIAQWLLQNS